MTRAAIYTRQSLDKDGSGLAIERQLADDERLCEARGWQVVARESDNDMSGYSGRERPGYERILAMMRSGTVDVVVVWAVDRLTRRLADLVGIIDLCEQTGVKIITVSGDLDLSTPTGKLLARILGSVAQGEVETKGARQRLANRQSAEAGKARMGMPRAFGWQPDRVTLDQAEAAAVRDACGTLLAGGTITAVIRDWDARGVYPRQRPRGHPFGPVSFTGWTRTSVREILGNPRNAGIAVYRGVEVGRGEWQPIVAEETHRAVRDVLAGNAAGRHAPARTLLGMLGRCRCGAPVTGTWSGDGKRPAYRCHQLSPERGEGPHVFVRRDLIDEWVSKLVIERLSRDDAIGLIEAPAGVDTAALRDEAEAVRKRLKRLGPLFAAGMITEDDMTGGRATGEARLAEIVTALADAGRESILGRLIMAENVAAEWEKLDVSLKRTAIGALMTVTINPPGRGAHKWDPGNVVGVAWVPSVAA